jgi:hypothetical protein
MRLRRLQFLFGLALVAFFLLAPTVFALAAAPPAVVAQEEAPYTPPDLDEAEVPSWLEPLQPLARLPLWGQAAVLSAGVAGLVFLVPMVARWVWRLGEGRESGSGRGEMSFNGKHEPPK